MASSSPNSRPGILVVLEGIDGTGKSTQIQRLQKALESRGHAVAALREPTDGPHGREIRRMAAEGRADPQRERALFVADRREDVAQNILPALQSGAIVLLDRYYYSTMAYQGARGVDPQAIERENEAFAPRPDLLVILELPVEEALKRVRQGRENGPDLFEHAEYLAQVQAQFGRITHPRLVRLDARQSPEALSRAILAQIDSVLEAR